MRGVVEGTRRRSPARARARRLADDGALATALAALAGPADQRRRLAAWSASIRRHRAAAAGEAPPRPPRPAGGAQARLKAQVDALLGLRRRCRGALDQEAAMLVNRRTCARAGPAGRPCGGRAQAVAEARRRPQVRFPVPGVNREANTLADSADVELPTAVSTASRIDQRASRCRTSNETRMYQKIRLAVVTRRKDSPQRPETQRW